MCQSCPYCQAAISAPALSQYDDYFFCPNCRGALSHHEVDIILYAMIFIALCMAPLILLFGANSLVALGLSMATYHVIRPRFLEAHFRLQTVAPEPHH